jgi:hypothetical protein
MSSSVADIFAAAGLRPRGARRWGTPVPETAPGVYVVAATEDPASVHHVRCEPPFAPDAVEHLLAVRPELRIDATRPKAEDLIGRLGGFWLPDEVVLYIGLASSVRSRVRAYTRTPLGAKRPHAGGWWLKTLATLDELWVHWAPTPDFADAERRMLREFCREISPKTRATLFDKERVMPFANLRGHDNCIKRHGIAGATGDL